VAEILEPHLQQKQWSSLRPSAVHKGLFSYPIAVKPGCRETWEWLLYTGVCDTISEKSPNNISHLLQEDLDIEQWSGKIQLSIHPQNLHHLDQSLMKLGHLDKIC
jgi:hypothetical protein